MNTSIYTNDGDPDISVLIERERERQNLKIARSQTIAMMKFSKNKKRMSLERDIDNKLI